MSALDLVNALGGRWEKNKGYGFAAVGAAWAIVEPIVYGRRRPADGVQPEFMWRGERPGADPPPYGCAAQPCPRHDFRRSQHLFRHIKYLLPKRHGNRCYGVKLLNRDYRLV